MPFKSCSVLLVLFHNSNYGWATSFASKNWKYLSDWSWKHYNHYGYRAEKLFPNPEAT